MAFLSRDWRLVKYKDLCVAFSIVYYLYPQIYPHKKSHLNFLICVLSYDVSLEMRHINMLFHLSLVEPHLPIIPSTLVDPE